MRKIILGALLFLGLMELSGCDSRHADAESTTAPTQSTGNKSEGYTVDTTSHESMHKSVERICAELSAGEAERFREGIEYLREGFPVARENPTAYDLAEHEAFHGKTHIDITYSALKSANAGFTPLRDTARVQLDVLVKKREPLAKIARDFDAAQKMLAPYALTVDITDELSFLLVKEGRGWIAATMELKNDSANPVEVVKFVVNPIKGPVTVNLCFKQPVEANSTGLAWLRRDFVEPPSVPNGAPAIGQERVERPLIENADGRQLLQQLNTSVQRTTSENIGAFGTAGRGLGSLLVKNAGFTRVKPGNDRHGIETIVIEVLGPGGKSLAKSPLPPDMNELEKISGEIAEVEERLQSLDAELAFWNGTASTSTFVRQSRVERVKRAERTCNTCSGFGFLNCGTCAGIGFTAGAAGPKVGNLVMCLSCGGTRRLSCHACDGSGLKGRPPG